MQLSWVNLAVYVPLLALVATAAVTDLRARRIPNWVSLSVAVAGLAQSLTPWGVTSVTQSLLGLLSGFAITFLLYILGGRGAGDVKLTAGIGAWLGPWAVVVMLGAAAVVSGISSIVRTCVDGKLLELLRNTGHMLLMLGSVRRLGLMNVLDSLRGWKSVGRPLPNGVSLLVATAGVVVWVSGKWVAG